MFPVEHFCECDSLPRYHKLQATSYRNETTEWALSEVTDVSAFSSPPQCVVLVHLSWCVQVLSIFGPGVCFWPFFVVAVSLSTSQLWSSVALPRERLPFCSILSCLVFLGAPCQGLLQVFGCMQGRVLFSFRAVIVSPHVTVVHIGDVVKDWSLGGASFTCARGTVPEMVCYHLHGSSVT